MVLWSVEGNALQVTGVMQSDHVSQVTSKVTLLFNLQENIWKKLLFQICFPIYRLASL